MKHPSKLKTWAVVLFGITFGLFMLFFLYVGIFEDVSVYQARPFLGCREVTDYTAEQVSDPSSPTGVSKIYRWALGEVSAGEECLSVYVVHHTVQVYLDDELVCSLDSAQSNRICASINSSWGTVPLYPEDSGKTVTVIATPIFESMISRVPEFRMGSRYEVLRSFLHSDLLEILLSGICILLGLFIAVIFVFLRLTGKSSSPDMIYMGTFSLLIGIWRITDMRTTTFFFSSSTVLLGYVTIGALCICVIPLLLMVSERFGGAFCAQALWLSIVVSCAALVTLFCQVTGIAEFRQMLTLCHVMLLLALVSTLASAVINYFQNRGTHQKQSLWYVAVLGISVLLDLVHYYTSGSSAGIDFTLIGFILFTLIQFARSVTETSTLAYTDAQTGLFNKLRWDMLMAREDGSHSSVGIMMLDLNCLKHTNDTLGHEAGDQMIFNFSNILRNTLPPSSVICRWGGDEFTVQIADATREEMEQSIRDLRAAADGYNRFGQGPAIYFAAGFALSSEYPGLSQPELLKKADEAMYRDKRAWYSQHPM